MSFVQTTSLKALLLSAFVLGLVGQRIGHAETTGLYKFDTLARDWSITNGPERFFDDSGNDLHFDVHTNLGTVSLSSDVPSVAPQDSLSLFYNFQRGLETPSTDLFTVGTTGELTVEFWYKPQLTDTLRYILSMTNAPNSWHISQATPLVNGTQGIDMFTKDSSGNVDRLKSQDQFLDAQNPEWIHLAFTFDDTSTMRMYRNGVLEDQASNFGPYGATSHTLRLGAENPSDTFSGKFLMDDLRISNVALLPGNGTGVNELAWNASLSEGPVAQPRDPNFGRQWVRSNPFMISSWGKPADQQLYTDANFNTALSSEALPNVAGHFLGSFDELTDDVRTSVQWGINAGVTGWLVQDEVPADRIAGTAAAADYIRLVDPDSLIYVSLASINPTYVDDVITTVQPDAFMYGFYPWEGPTNATDKLRAHLDNMQTARQKSLQYDIPVFSFVQSFDDLNNPFQNPNDNNRLPSGSELRTELFTKLAAGFKGVAYYLFDLENQSTRFEKALVDRDGIPSELYPHAQQANAEVLVLGESLRYLESTDWRHIWGGVTSFTPNTIPQWDANAGQGQIDSIVIEGAAADRKDAMVGYFEDDLGEEYFMLVNMWHGVGMDPADLTADFTITFDNTIDTIWRLNRLSGLVEEIALTDNALTFSLPGGTGDLFKINNGNFAGLSLTLPGDFNGDGSVDTADYVLWRANDGSPEGYQDWVSNFGNTAGSGNGSPAAVPEPNSVVLLIVAFVLSCSGCFAGRNESPNGNFFK